MDMPLSNLMKILTNWPNISTWSYSLSSSFLPLVVSVPFWSCTLVRSLWQSHILAFVDPVSHSATFCHLRRLFNLFTQLLVPTLHL
ncbi:hypothetical protein CPB83DRAFT_865398 [Crepidotus variabilis]|uniref:Uncharacterized protein n=1 Tax=Crepidotus variabilis TaxID=179855 RepID=A0A9P6JHU2_9AGAR|nr:hypothetical protein CPB83DRAFT_865398 [Crepidotus variabilis]